MPRTLAEIVNAVTAKTISSADMFVWQNLPRSLLTAAQVSRSDVSYISFELDEWAGPVFLCQISELIYPHTVFDFFLRNGWWLSMMI